MRGVILRLQFPEEVSRWSMQHDRTPTRAASGGNVSTTPARQGHQVRHGPRKPPSVCGRGPPGARARRSARLRVVRAQGHGPVPPPGHARRLTRADSPHRKRKVKSPESTRPDVAPKLALTQRAHAAIVHRNVSTPANTPRPARRERSASSQGKLDANPQLPPHVGRTLLKSPAPSATTRPETGRRRSERVHS